MDFINKNLAGVFKVALVIVAVSIFVNIIPTILLVAIAGWGGFKVYRYFCALKNKAFKKKEEVHVDNNLYSEEDYFDLSDRNIVDVEYEDVRK